MEQTWEQNEYRNNPRINFTLPAKTKINQMFNEEMEEEEEEEEEETNNVSLKICITSLKKASMCLLNTSINNCIVTHFPLF
jgi:hypothetical protein